MASAASRAHARCRPTPSNKRTSKRPPPARPSGRKRLPSVHRRAVGRRRASHRAEADPAQGLVLRRPAADRPGAASLRVALSHRLVPPPPGRTVFHLATTVSIPLFEVELAAFARQVGASPTKQIILVLDRAGWHKSLRLRVPDHVYLLFLPAYCHSPGA